MDLIEVEAVTNKMFQCTAKYGVYFARITNYKVYDELLEEVTYTSYLHKEGLGVSPAIVSINGKHCSRNQWNANVFLICLY